MTETPPEWSLSDLYGSSDDPRLDDDIVRATASAVSLAERFRGRLHTISSAEFATLLTEYDALQDSLGKIGSYAQLLRAGDREDEAVGKFYQRIKESLNAITSELLFVTLEMNRLGNDKIEALLAEPAAARYRSWIEVVRAFRQHQLSDEVESKLHEKSITGPSAWVRLFDETMASLRFELDGEELISAQIFDKLSSPDRGLRERAGRSIAATLRANGRLLAGVHNVLIKDKQIEDGWRNYAVPISSRNLANQVEDEVVEALITAVKDAYPRTAHRYYQLKAKWLGLERLQFWDRNAPLPFDDDRRRPWTDAKLVVLDAYRQFSPKLAGIVEQFFERQWIDANPRAGKDSGAFCHPTVPSVHPYVLMNYQGRNRDIMTLAHELGHGVHQVLASEQGPILSSTPLTLAETASVFGEQLTFRALLDDESDATRRRLLLAGKIEDMINTVVRQIAFCDFEQRMHQARRDGELSVGDLGDIWFDVQRESLGPAVELDEDYRVFWSYIPHFVHVPFYVYAYAFGDCLVNALYAVYREQPDGFEGRYLELLRAGGTKRHYDLLAPFGLDAREPDFWGKGLKVLEELIDELEQEQGGLQS